MHERDDEKRNEEPELCARIADGLVLKDELKNEILVKEGSEVVADTVSLHIAHHEIEDSVEEKAEGKVTEGSSCTDEGALRLILLCGVGEITADEKEHRHRETEERKIRVCIIVDMNAYDEKGKEETEEIKICVSVLLHKKSFMRKMLYYNIFFSYLQALSLDKRRLIC